jgi:hypothetical protein
MGHEDRSRGTAADVELGRSALVLLEKDNPLHSSGGQIWVRLCFPLALLVFKLGVIKTLPFGRSKAPALARSLELATRPCVQLITL